MKTEFGEIYLSNMCVPALPRDERVGGYTTEVVWLITRDNEEGEREYWSLDATWGPFRPHTLWFQTTAQAKACVVGLRNFTPDVDSLEDNTVTQLIVPPKKD